MSVASLMIVTIVLTPLVLLVFDLFAHRGPDPTAPPARGVRH